MISLLCLNFGLIVLVLIFMLSYVEAVGSSVKIYETWFAVGMRVEAFSMEVEASFQ